jgi:PAS domain S-box-containing protein
MSTNAALDAILLVEDEAIIAMSEKRSLERYGYEIITARSGEEAVETVREDCRIGMALLDINLGPGIDGIEAAEEILSIRDVPVIFLSSHAEPEIMERVGHIPSYGYVTKSSGLPVLLASISAAYRLRDANERIKAEIEGRLKVERALTENEKKYRSLFKSMGQGFYVASILYDDRGHPCDYRYVDVNEAFERILGLDRDAIVGRTYNELVPPDPASGWPECFRRVAETGVSENYSFTSEIYRTHFETYAFKPEEGMFAALVKDVTDRVGAEERIRGLLKEKELILKEAHHRIKNDMGIVSGLLALQADAMELPAAREGVLKAAGCVRSMELLYERLYRTEGTGRLSAREFLGELIDGISMILPHRAGIRVESRIADVELESRKLSTIGIIVNELATNAVKHAFEGRESGVIGIALTEDGDRLTLLVQDDGIGLPVREAIVESGGFGLELVRHLAEQLGGALEIERGGGTAFRIAFEA